MNPCDLDVNFFDIITLMSLLNEVRVDSAIIVKKKKNCDDKAFIKKQSLNTYATTRIVQ